MLFCGIDTSNYTTSAAVCDEEGRVLANLKKMLPVRDGECGLRQSDAVFSHIRNLPEVMEQLGTYTKNAAVAAVGVSSKPRDAEDSYMPCFLCGVSAAESFCAGSGAELYRFSHQQGHIMASFWTSGMKNAGNADDPFIAFHVSGGTTEMLLVRPEHDSFNIELAGGTEDLNAGQAIDRVGVALGMHFPCGVRMDAEASSYCGKIHRAQVCVQGLKCNLSGLQNLSEKLIRSGESTPAVCAFVFDFIGNTLFKLAQNARMEFGNLPIVWAGGVMSNTHIKQKLSRLENCYFTEPQYSADNAVGTALLCRRKYLMTH